MDGGDKDPNPMPGRKNASQMILMAKRKVKEKVKMRKRQNHPLNISVMRKPTSKSISIMVTRGMVK